MKSKTRISKFFETLIYFILLTIPMISVFARTIYVQSNPNAKDSYSDSYIRSSLIISNNNQLTTGSTYELTDFSSSFGGYSNTYYYSSISSNDWTNFPTNDYIGFRFEKTGNNYGIRLYYYDATDTIVSLERHSSSYTFVKSLFPRTFVLSSYVVSNDNNFNNYVLEKLVLVPNSIDNAFDYGLQKTIDDFGTGNINFLNWFGTMFSNNTNLLYINFVNMYLNYALWVSVGYLLYYFLNWFIRFVRETLDNLIYKETKN